MTSVRFFGLGLIQTVEFLLYIQNHPHCLFFVSDQVGNNKTGLTPFAALQVMQTDTDSVVTKLHLNLQTNA